MAAPATRNKRRATQAGRPGQKQASKKEKKAPTERQLRNQAKKRVEVAKLNGIFYILRVTTTYFFVLPAWICKQSVFIERRGWHHLAAHLKAERRKVKGLDASLAPVDGKWCRCMQGGCHVDEHGQLCGDGERCPGQKRLGTDFCTTCASKTEQGCERGYRSKEAASRCKKGIQGYNATKLPVCQGCSTSHYGLLLGTPLANAKNLLPGGEDSTQLLAARVMMPHHDPQQPPAYEIWGRFRGPTDKSDPTNEANNGGFIRQGDMIYHSNPSIQGIPELVVSLMDCVFKLQHELPASGCIKVRREVNGEVKMLEVQPTVDAVEEEVPPLVEEEHPPFELFTDLAFLDLFPPVLENEWEKRCVGFQI